MKTPAVVIAAFLVVLAPIIASQELVMTGFPLGVGGSIDRDFFAPYRSDLKAIADTLRRNPTVQAVIVGGADGERYRENNDAKNPGLALGRAHALRNWLINQFGVDSTQLLIQTRDVELIGPRYRSVSIRIVRDQRAPEFGPTAQILATPQTPPSVGTPASGNDLTEHMGIQVGAGMSTSPYGAIPFVSAAVTWKRLIFVEGTLGYTFWNGTFRYQNGDLDTRRRMAGGQVVVYPFNRSPLGIVGGWTRVEEISQAYYAYVRLSEGPILGLRTSAFDIITTTGAYNPVKQRIAGSWVSHAKNDQFLLSIGISKTFGGSR